MCLFKVDLSEKLELQMEHMRLLSSSMTKNDGLPKTKNPTPGITPMCADPVLKSPGSLKDHLTSKQDRRPPVILS